MMDDEALKMAAERAIARIDVVDMVRVHGRDAYTIAELIRLFVLRELRERMGFHGVDVRSRVDRRESHIHRVFADGEFKPGDAFLSDAMVIGSEPAGEGGRSIITILTTTSASCTGISIDVDFGPSTARRRFSIAMMLPSWVG